MSPVSLRFIISQQALLHSSSGVDKEASEWINNKVLLYSIGNYIQNPMINHIMKNMKKRYIYV